MRLRRLVLIAIAAGVLFMVGASTGSTYIGYGHGHNGWVKWTIYEQFGVRATEVYLKMGYYQDTWSVQGGTFRDGYCWHSAFPGWSIPRCGYAVLQSGPSDVAYRIIGEFHGAFGIDYQQQARWGASSNNTTWCSIFFDHGGYPNFWSGNFWCGRE